MRAPVTHHRRRRQIQLGGYLRSDGKGFPCTFTLHHAPPRISMVTPSLPLVFFCFVFFVFLIPLFVASILCSTRFSRFCQEVSLKQTPIFKRSVTHTYILLAYNSVFFPFPRFLTRLNGVKKTIILLLRLHVYQLCVARRAIDVCAKIVSLVQVLTRFQGLLCKRRFN